MNIDRGLAQLGVAKAEARASSPSREDAGKPVFSLPQHDAAHGSDAGRPTQATRSEGTSRSDGPTSRRADREPETSAHASASDTANAHSPDTAKPQDGPNAAARRQKNDGNRTADERDDAATPQASAETTSQSSEGERRSAPPGNDDALPDRMLALLSGAPLAPTTPASTTASLPAIAPGAAGGDAALTAPMQASGAPLVTEMSLGTPALGATPAPAAPGVPTSTDALMAVTGDTRAVAGAPTAPQTGVPIPRGTSLADLPALGATLAPAASAAVTSTDAFAALAAFTDRTRDGATSTGDGGTAPGGSAFAPLLARGTDALQATARAAAVTPPAPLPLMLDADFDDGLGARVTWMAEQRIDHAQIRVSPEALGPIDVRLQLDGHRVNAQFHAANADVQQALESGMDRLRDLLGRRGMELGQAQVGSGSRQGTDGRSSGQPAPVGTPLGDATSGEIRTTRVALPRSRGLLDEYA